MHGLLDGDLPLQCTESTNGLADLVNSVHYSTRACPYKVIHGEMAVCLYKPVTDHSTILSLLGKGLKKVVIFQILVGGWVGKVIFQKQNMV